MKEDRSQKTEVRSQESEFGSQKNTFPYGVLTPDFCLLSSFIPHPSSLNSFLIFAKNCAQAIGNFSQCRVNLHRSDDFGDEILARTRYSFDFSQGGNHCSLLSLCANLP